MIQRIQSLYLLLVLVLTIVCQFFTMGRFLGGDGEPIGEMNNFTIVQADKVAYTTWALGVLLILVSIATFLSICLFRKRMRQIRLCLFSSILLIGYYIVYVVFIFYLMPEGGSFRPALAASFPLLALILNWLAIRAIGADEMLVRSLDRIR
ncbi:MAG: DUF4293 domain-containing protein [Bacteroidaceae bacterium]|nr:DUF4293 domain-containing protein [Bacteroidaceae bacterium]MDO4955402.1 DUF4293 domain-containing protein [Bacteroidales bacterium]